MAPAELARRRAAAGTPRTAPRPWQPTR
jgi:hypothetical protein